MAALTELVKIPPYDNPDWQPFPVPRSPFPVTATPYWLSATSKGDVTLLNKLAFGYVHA